jgi:hypothetical protein
MLIVWSDDVEMDEASRLCAAFNEEAACSLLDDATRLRGP